jgi:ferrous-iron efflux pump FieF
MFPGKQSATVISLSTAVMLAVVKLIGGIATGSVSVIASAVDSILDIGSSTLNYFAIKQAEQPPDPDHRYGHGKFESFASLLQSILISLSGMYILYEAYKRFTDDSIVHNIEGGIYVMLFSLAVTLVLVFFLRTVAKKENSTILKAESLHYEIDLLTGVGILLGLVLVKLTGINAIDPFISVLIALKTIYSAFGLGKEVSDDLLDKALDAEDMEKIDTIIKKYSKVIANGHHIRTRRGGAKKFVDLHINVNPDLTVLEAHMIADMIENEISETLGGADVQIHVEPCDDTCCSVEACNTDCENIKEEIKKLIKKEGAY